MKRWAALFASLSVIAFVRPAAAQDTSFCEPHTLGGTNGFRTARLLGTTHARAFGTPQFAERALFPILGAGRGDDDLVFVSVYEGNWVYNATQVPTHEIGDGCPAEYQYALREVDTGAFNVGVAAGYGRFSVFYAGGLTASSAFGYESAESRSTLPLQQSLLGLPMAFLAPLYNKRGIDDGTTYAVLDYMVGVGADAGGVDLRVGYVGSTGVYSNLSERQLRLFLAALVEESFSEVPYLKGGIDKLKSPFGYTSLFGRSLPLYAPPRYDAATAEAEDTSTSARLGTAHLEQLNVARVFDVKAAYAFAPESLLHELRAGVHTPGFHQIPSDEEAVRSLDGFAGGAAFYFGRVQLPAMYYYGVEGGGRTSLRFEAQALVGEGQDQFGLNVSLRRNEPEVLSLFPYAQDAWSFYFKMHVTGR